MFLRFFKEKIPNIDFHQTINPDLELMVMNYLDRDDITRLGMVDKGLRESSVVPRVSNLVSQYRLEDKEARHIQELQKQGLEVQYQGNKVSNPILLALHLELMKNPRAFLQRTLIASPCEKTLYCSAYEYTILTGNFVARNMILNNPDIKEAKDLPDSEQVLAACPIKFLQLEKLIEGFSLFLERHGGTNSLKSGFNIAQCYKDYAELIGKNYKLVPAWIAQLYSSGSLFGAPDDFLQTILEADSTDRLTRHKSYYAGHRGEKGAVCFYQDLFNSAFYFCGGWASCEVVAVNYSDRQAIINLDALIKKENPTLKPTVAPSNR